MICDICDAPGKGTIVKAVEFRKAVRKGFNSIYLMTPYQQAGWELKAILYNRSDAYSCWKHDALHGAISRSDWNVCKRCMQSLQLYLPSSYWIRRESGSSVPKTGCYIATACYGDYDAPEVLVFRQFRDEFLLRSYLGKLIVEVYYKFSPFLARKLKEYYFLNNVVRALFLNPIHKIIVTLKTLNNNKTNMEEYL